MRFNKYILALTTLGLVISCGNYNQQLEPTVQTKESGVETTTGNDQQQLNVSSSASTPDNAYKTPAIGNLYLGVNAQEFESAKEIFLKNNPTLNGLTIQKIIPILNNNKIERIIVVSKIHKYPGNDWRGSFGYFDHLCEYDYWSSLYLHKYGSLDTTIHGKDIYVRDDFPINPTAYVFAFGQEYERDLIEEFYARRHKELVDAFSVIIITNHHIADSLSRVRKQQSYDAWQSDISTI